MIQICLDIITFITLKFYSFFNTPPIIRYGTTDCTIFWQICIFKDLKLPKKITPKIIVDAGAYTGLSTKFYAEKYPNSKIIAIEPEQSNFNLLEKNISKLKNVSSINAALWYKKTFMQIKDPGLGHCAFTVKKDTKENYDIKTITIPEILNRFNLDKIDVLKIDIEGAEKELFSQNYKSWIDKVNIIVIELHDRLKSGCSETFKKALKDGNWHITQRGEKVMAIKSEISI